MSYRALPLVLVFALAVPLSAAFAVPAAADPPSGSPFDFIPAEALASPQQVRDDGAVLIEVTVLDAASLDAVRAELEQVAEVVTVADDFGVVVAWMQPELIDAITARADVLSVIAPPPPSTGGLSLMDAPADWITAPSCRSVPVESDGPLQSAIARAEGGVDGTGITVGVISDSFNVAENVATTAADDVALGALPGPGNPCGYETPVVVVSDATEGSDEGRAMAQLVHGIAPGAQLLFANGFPSAFVMADNIRALVAAGADIIVDDLSFYAEPIAQAGVLADAIQEARDAGVAYFSSAGNASIVSQSGTQIGGWASSSFTTAPCPALLQDPTVSCLDFGLTTPDSTNRITAKRDADGTLVFSAWLRWSEPWYGIAVPMGMALLTTDPVAPKVVAASLCSDAAPTDPSTCSQPWSSATYGTVGTPGEILDLDLVVFTDAAPALLAGVAVSATFREREGLIGGLEHDESGTGQGRDVTVGATLTVNNAAKGVFAVGAADVAEPDELEYFSSWGQTTWRWQSVSSKPVGTPANALATPWTRAGADAVGIDGALTTFFGGGNRFTGTSAAAPTVAAVAALMAQAVPGITNDEIDAALRSSANPAIAGPVGVDPVTAIGAGLVDADAALAAAGAVPHPLAAPVPAPMVPADTAALVKAQSLSAGGIPELVASVAGGVATVTGLPDTLTDWAWVYGYSTATDQGWRPVTGGVLTLNVADWSVGQHHLGLFRGDDLMATALVSIATPGTAMLTPTGADAGAPLGLGIGLLGLGVLVLGGLVVLRRGEAERRARSA